MKERKNSLVLCLRLRGLEEARGCWGPQKTFAAAFLEIKWACRESKEIKGDKRKMSQE